MTLLDEEERYRINVFDWASNFPQVFTGGNPGFDAVIGNPPYIRIQALKEWAPIEVEYYKKAYSAASKGNYDIYVVFVEHSLELLNKNGQLGFILPHKFFNAKYGAPLRQLIAEGKHLSEVVHFGDEQVFSGATTYTCLMFLDKAGTKECRFVKVDDLVEWRVNGEAEEGQVATTKVTTGEWNFVVGSKAALFERLQHVPTKLGDITRLFVGLQTDADDVFILEEIERDGELVLCQSKSTGGRHWLEDEHLKPFLKGSLNIRRYQLSDVNKRLIFPYEIRNGKSVFIEADEYKQRYP
jgi:Eco57I restriction-modification methylase